VKILKISLYSPETAILAKKFVDSSARIVAKSKPVFQSQHTGFQNQSMA
jgi:hypothetical protein